MRQSTVVYLLLLLVAFGAYYFINNREEPADIAITLEPQDIVTYLFSAEDGIPTGIRIEAKSGEVVEVARNADDAWALKQPIAAAADQASVDALAGQIPILQIEDTLPGIDLAIVGLKDPDYTLVVQFKEDVERTVGIGVITPTENGYYALTPDGEVVIIGKYSVDALLGLLNNPPYLETPTPSPTATASPTPLPATPEPFDPTQGTPASPTPATATPQP